MANGRRIIVGISGGVDSAVAALCLLRAGYDVQGLHMTNWSGDEEYCTAAEDYRQARAVCGELGIVLHHADFSAAYREQVFSEFLREHRAGRTPNPDVLCNRHIKFGTFLEHARRLGADGIATGHYARRSADPAAPLLTSVDRRKDQTYFLHAVSAPALAQTLFPLGALAKAEVRQLANAAGLPNHDRPDSTGICFIGEQPFRAFLSRYLADEPGPMLTPEGRVVGRHAGLAFYTLGQRSGLGIGGSAEAAQAPWYVAAKDTRRNALIVVQGRDHPLLYAQELRTEAPHWIGHPPPELDAGLPLVCTARLRHRHEPAPCTVWIERTGSLHVRFDDPQWAPTPGQYAVFYRGEICLGGAVIEQATPGVAGFDEAADTARNAPATAMAKL